MKIYKLSVDDQQIHKIIDEKAFLNSLPRRSKPWIGTDKSGSNTVYYAVCPFCRNPIRMVGLLHKPDSQQTPYAKHYMDNVENLAVYVQQAYDNCIYASKNKIIGNKELRRQGTDPESLHLLHLLKTELDRVIKILSEDSGIYFTPALIEKMLESYRQTSGWTYLSSYPYNLPWTFANIITAQNLYGRLIYRNSDLAKKLQQMDFIKLGPARKEKYYQIASSTSKFLDLTFEFRNLRLVKSEDGGSGPRITFVVHYKPERSLSSLRVVYAKDIDIDEMRFQTLLQEQRSESQQEFAALCRDLASKILP